MNKTVTITSKNHKYANIYGGNIYITDFNTSYDGTKKIASRIETDFKFDKQCMKNIKARTRIGEILC